MLPQIAISAKSGAFVLSNFSFEYIDPPEINDVSPSSGQGGTKVTITGDRLRGGGTSITTVTLASEPATIEHENASMVVVFAGASKFSGKGHVFMVADSGAIATISAIWR